MTTEQTVSKPVRITNYRMRKAHENEIKKAVIEYLIVRKIFHWRQNSGAVKAYYRPKKTKEYKERYFKFIKFGYPFDIKLAASDIAGIYKNRFFAIEIKTKEGILSEEQKNYIDTVNENGGLAFVARSIDDVIYFFNHWDELNK